MDSGLLFLLECYWHIGQVGVVLAFLHDCDVVRRGLGYVVVGGWFFLYLTHSLRLVVLIMTVESLFLVWSSFMVLCFYCIQTFPCPLPLLLSKSFSSSCKTIFFHEFAHNLIITCTHLPCIIPLPSPLSSRYPQSLHTIVILLKVHLEYVFSTGKHLNW